MTITIRYSVKCGDALQEVRDRYQLDDGDITLIANALLGCDCYVDDEVLYEELFDQVQETCISPPEDVTEHYTSLAGVMPDVVEPLLPYLTQIHAVGARSGYDVDVEAHRDIIRVWLRKFDDV